MVFSITLVSVAKELVTAVVIGVIILTLIYALDFAKGINSSKSPSVTETEQLVLVIRAQ